MKRILSLIVACGMAARVLSAETSESPRLPERLDLKSAIRFALDNSFAIRQARERIKQQDGVLVQVRAAELPGVTASGSYQLNEKSISQTTPSSSNFWQVSLIAQETLYAGGSVQSGIKNAALNREAAILDLQGSVNQAILDVRSKFYAVLLTRDKVKVQEENVALLKAQLADATNRVDAGTASSFDRLRASVSLANAQVPLITARNDYRIAVEQLLQSLGVASRGADTTVAFDGDLAYESSSFDLQGALDSARANRPEIKRLEKLVDAGQESVIVAKSSYYPNLSVSGAWEDEKNPYTVLPNSSSSLSGWYVGLKSQWAIFDGAATRGKVLQARSIVEQSRLSLADESLAVDVAVRQAYSAWQEATELVDATRKTVGQAEESLRLARARYDSGAATQLDVQQAQVDLTQARTNEVQANYTYLVAIASLRQAMGLSDSYIQE